MLHSLRPLSLPPSFASIFSSSESDVIFLGWPVHGGISHRNNETSPGRHIHVNTYFLFGSSRLPLLLPSTDPHALGHQGRQ